MMVNLTNSLNINPRGVFDAMQTYGFWYASLGDETISFESVFKVGL